jgi:uncharacterized protein (TIGR03435 family)
VKLLIILLWLTAFHVPGQTFEVASIRPVRIGEQGVQISGGPGTGDPGRIAYLRVTLKILLINAFDLPPWQFSGPNWLNLDRYGINATLPRGATQEQMRLMLRNLLADRFKMVLHREKREMNAFLLLVNKNGPKLALSDANPLERTTASAAPQHSLPAPKLPIATEGFPEFPANPRTGPSTIVMPGKAKFNCIRCSVSALTHMLENQVQRPVIDGTGLTGKYSFTIIFEPEFRGVIIDGGSLLGSSDVSHPSAPPEEPAPHLLAALQEQPGLKLDQTKGPVEMVVIDHVEKVPTDN